jgi:hypothetical protein
MEAPTVGQRVKTAVNCDFYPDFIIPAGSEGTVIGVDEIGGEVAYITVKFDKPIKGCEEWNNEVTWSPEHFYHWSDGVVATPPADFVAEWRTQVTFI